MESFPSGPYSLVAGYTFKRTAFALVMGAAALGIAGGYGIWQLSEARDLLRENRIWNDPSAIEVPANVDGKVTTHKFILNGYDLKIAFTTDDGQDVNEKREFSTLIGKVDKDSDAMVRYLPADPHRFVLSWANSVRPSRWAAFWFMFLAGVGLIGGSLGTIAWSHYRTTRETVEAAQSGMPTWCALESVSPQVVNNKETGLFEYVYTTPRGNSSKVMSHKTHGVPITREQSGRAEVLTVMTVNGAALVPLREDLFPLRFDQPQHNELLAALHR